LGRAVQSARPGAKAIARLSGAPPKPGGRSMFEDKTIGCRDCGEQFVFTAGEQGFYLEKGLLNDPQRCPTCRASRRRERTTVREGTTITCANCGTQATVPFIPRLDRPVYCSDCFSDQKTTRIPAAVA
jgi:CxxC-x17-CxxC domain-containing protein